MGAQFTNVHRPSVSGSDMTTHSLRQFSVVLLCTVIPDLAVVGMDVAGKSLKVWLKMGVVTVCVVTRVVRVVGL
jgi:hypothetical protein